MKSASNFDRVQKRQIRKGIASKADLTFPAQLADLGCPASTVVIVNGQTKNQPL